MVLPRSIRLKGYKCFDLLYREGARYYGSSMTLRVTKPNPILFKTKKNFTYINSLKGAVSISHKVSKKAVVRNKIRRLFHNYLAEKITKVNPNNVNWFLLSLKPNCANTKPEILLKECEYLLIKSGLIK